MPTKIMKAVEFDKLPAKFKKSWLNVDNLWKSGDYFLMPKYDGCYGLFIKSEDSVTALTRTGELIRSCDHICEQIKVKFAAFKHCFVIGELWTPKFKFPEISGMVRKHSPAPDLWLMVHDFIEGGMLATTAPFEERLKAVHNLPLEYPVCVVNVHTYDSMPHLTPLGLAQNLKELGKYDGAILRHRKLGYTVGLVKQGEIVKVKPNIALDLRVTNVLTDVGEKTGRPVYSIEVEYRGVTSFVGSGMPHNFHEVPKVGQIVEIVAMGLTEDGKLREPRFKGTRFDKLEPDT